MTHLGFLLARTLRREAPLAALSAPEAELFADLRGKRVALVGNARALTERNEGAEIDSADIVIRINRAPMPASRTHGTRTDWLALATTIGADDLDRIRPRRILWMSHKRKRLPWRMAGGAGKREVSIGTIVCAIRSEAHIATTMGTATCARKIVSWLRSPKRIGRKTTTQVAVPASVATPTSRTPASVAAAGLPGSSWRCRNTLSVTTTALSTSMPIASIMPIIDMTLIVRSRKYIAASVTSSESGTARLTISVVGQCRRKRKSTSSASTAPISPASPTSARERRMEVAWLSIT